MKSGARVGGGRGRRGGGGRGGRVGLPGRKGASNEVGAGAVGPEGGCSRCVGARGEDEGGREGRLVDERRWNRGEEAR